MARNESTALVVVGILLVLAQRCATQDPNDPRTVGLSSGLMSSSPYAGSYSTGSGYNSYSPYPYTGVANNYGYYGGYQPTGYAREVASSGPAVPDCQSGLLKPSKQSTLKNDQPGPSQMSQGSRSSSSFQTDEQLISNNMIYSDPKSAQSFTTSTVQQSTVQEVPSVVSSMVPSVVSPLVRPVVQTTPVIYSDSFHHPYGMRAFNHPQLVSASHYVEPNQLIHMRAANGVGSMAMNPTEANKFRMVPSQLHFIDPSHTSARQYFPLTSNLDLTYNPQDMMNTYGVGNYQPPIFRLAKTQNSAYRGLQTGYPYSYPIDSRFLAGGISQPIPVRRIEHPLPAIRESTPVDHINQPLPPNLYRSGKWEPVTNLNIENPINLEEFENTGFSMQGSYPNSGSRASATPLCREKRATDLSWMYPFSGWASNDVGLGQQRAAALPSIPPPLTPYHGPYTPLSEIFPSSQQLMGPQQHYPGYSNPQAKGAVEGIQQIVSGMAQMVPMFAGASPLYK